MRSVFIVLPDVNLAQINYSNLFNYFCVETLLIKNFMLSQTIIIIIVTAFTSIISFNNQKVYGDLIMYPPAVNRGQYYRLLTSGFIHADYNHLIFNMLTLYFFGRTVENAMDSIIGKYGFLALYLGGIIISDIPS